MALPLDKLYDETRNIYEVSCAMIERANQLTKIKENIPESGIDKPVHDAISAILNEDITFVRQIEQ